MEALTIMANYANYKDKKWLTGFRGDTERHCIRVEGILVYSTSSELEHAVTLATIISTVTASKLPPGLLQAAQNVVDQRWGDGELAAAIDNLEELLPRAHKTP